MLKSRTSIISTHILPKFTPKKVLLSILYLQTFVGCPILFYLKFIQEILIQKIAPYIYSSSTKDGR